MTDWLEREIGHGLQGLVALRLQGAPAEDMITLTLDVWLEALRSASIDWIEHLDAPRLVAGFKTLFRTCDRWPAPRMLLDALPRRQYPIGLPSPEITEEQAARNRERVHALCTELLRKIRAGDFENGTKETDWTDTEVMG